MSEKQSVDETLDDIFGVSEDSDLASKISELTAVSETVSRGEKRKRELKKEILAALDSIGATRITIAGRTIYTSTRTYYGIDASMLEKAKAWLEKVAPEANVPSNTNVAKAVNAFLDENPSENVPEFIVKSETVVLNNKKA